ncbi:HET-domain-containing protein [Trematosphaeria pertusa]|uniref:HET-domain-containing protein n=1 Tax=Trematosphaeria pertusa TaxID=390896 RepID=A0A6A6IB49_9PLEO|nr:HET-domain-containing protein [Trematosphaeria pertusa]KAF2247437.1 HET-domain-containing protein [Trematosphaeria pertusa]
MDQAETSGAPSEALNHSNSTATYVYRPVESARTIRLLELYQGAHNDPLRGNLFHLGLDDTSDEDSSPSWPNVWLDEETKHTATSYEALSYVWGPPSYTHSLSCVEGTIPITPSLDEALRRIRFENRHRIVWADGVCINQHDIQERGHQVKLMGVIYDRATKVLVWLGPDAGNRARESFDYFKGYHSHINDTGDRLVLDMVRYCQWFERLWVVQEVALSRSAVAMWGNEEMDFGPLAEAILDYDKRLPKHTLCAADNYAKRRSVALGTPIDILASARGLKCADDHDRVYALLGFSSLSPRYMRKMDMAIEPDYTLPLHDLYYEVAIRAIEGGAFSELLTQVDHGGVLARWPTGLPSWVPDWRKSIALPPRIDLGRVTPSINKATASLNITGYCFDVLLKGP